VVKPIRQAVLREVLERWWPGGESGVSAPSSGARASDESAPSEPPPTVAVQRVFLRSVPEQLAELTLAISDGDARRLAATAHKLKGGCLAVGAGRMASLCAELEKGPADRAALRVELEREFARVATRWPGLATPSIEAGRTG
jgi:HPt (histidine-containing phosphotransfer) domain-containing protein